MMSTKAEGIGAICFPQSVMAMQMSKSRQDSGSQNKFTRQTAHRRTYQAWCAWRRANHTTYATAQNICLEMRTERSLLSLDVLWSEKGEAFKKVYGKFGPLLD